MRLHKLQKELELISLLAEARGYTVAELCERLGMSARSLYYYLDFLRYAGFTIEKSSFAYRLDRSSPFFRKLHESIDFTEEEAVMISRMMEKADTQNPLVRSIMRKLSRFYDFRILTDVSLKQQVASNISRLYDAIKTKRMAKLVGYSSPHGHTVSDRVVEPFLFMANNMEVRCYDLGSEQNKTFKVSRIADVEIIDLLWANEARHRQMFTDAFGFSGEEKHAVRLLPGQLARNLLAEEYPEATAFLVPQADGRWLLALDVASFVGIGRFVLGLLEDIEVLGNEPFKTYLKEKAGKIQQSL